MTKRRAPLTRPPAVAGTPARLVCALVVGLLCAAWWSSAPAAAHAELTSSDPANASTVTEPVETVTFTFSKASEPDPERFTITGPGGPVGIDSVTADDEGRVITLRPAEPLSDGRFRVGWAIRSGDTHRMNGAISFTVRGSTAASAGSAATAAGSAGAAATTTPAPTPTPAPTTTLPVAPPGTDPLAASTDLGTPLTDRVATFLRGGIYLALLGAVGGTAYLSLVHRGPRRETRGLVVLVHRSAAAAALLSLAAVPVAAAVLDGGWGGLWSPAAWVDALSSGLGIATVLRVVGAGMVLVFLGVSLVPVGGPSGLVRSPGDVPVDPPAPQPEAPLFAGGSTLVAAPPAVPAVRRSRRNQPVRIGPAPLAWLGAALLVVSETFLGHTADTSPRLLMAAGDAVHLAAGGLWAAGVALLMVTARRRRSVAGAASLAPLAARFSTLAAWSLAAVALSGVVMGALILGDLAALWSSAFGRVLIVKVLLVAVVVGLGAYHRRELLPRLDGPDGPEPDALARLRVTLGIESALFVAVVALTAVLVAASPVP